MRGGKRQGVRSHKMHNIGFSWNVNSRFNHFNSTPKHFKLLALAISSRSNIALKAFDSTSFNHKSIRSYINSFIHPSIYDFIHHFPHPYIHPSLPNPSSLPIPILQFINIFEQCPFTVYSSSSPIFYYLYIHSFNCPQSTHSSIHSWGAPTNPLEEVINFFHCFQSCQSRFFSISKPGNYKLH